MNFDALTAFIQAMHVPPRWVSVTGQPAEWLEGCQTGDGWVLTEFNEFGALVFTLTFDAEEAFVEAVYLRLSQPPAFVLA